MEYKDLLGIPFKMGGRSNLGMDCWGIVEEIHRRLGHEVGDPMSGCWRPVVGALEVGDVLVFSYNGSGAVTHCAVWLGDDHMIHALERIGVIVSPFRHLKKRYLKAYRYAKVDSRT